MACVVSTSWRNERIASTTTEGVLVGKPVLAAIAATALVVPAGASAQQLPNGGIGYAKTIGKVRVSKSGKQAVRDRPLLVLGGQPPVGIAEAVAQRPA
jgi:hypothetical protein